MVHASKSLMDSERWHCPREPATLGRRTRGFLHRPGSSDAGVSPNHIRILLYQGQLVGGKKGHDYVISVESVRAALEDDI